MLRGTVAVLAVAATPLAAAAEPALQVVGTELRAPPDSHEPQRARVTLRGAGEGPGEAVLACTFSGEDGGTLQTVEAPVRSPAAGAETVAEVIYYGWPRASRVACRPGGAR